MFQYVPLGSGMSTDRHRSVIIGKAVYQHTVRFRSEGKIHLSHLAT